MTKAEVQALFAERDALWQSQLQQLTQVFGTALHATRANAESAPKTKTVLKFDITYGKDNCIASVVPIYAK
jgi:hypothetical protein